MKNITKFIKDECGSELVELVICFPLIVFMLSMLISYGQIFVGTQTALNAAAAGSRIAITQENATMARNKANQIVNQYISTTGMGVTYVQDEMLYSSWTRESICTYKVTINVKTVIPILNFSYGRIESDYKITKGCPMMIEKE